MHGRFRQAASADRRVLDLQLILPCTEVDSRGNSQAGESLINGVVRQEDAATGGAIGLRDHFNGPTLPHVEERAARLAAAGRCTDLRWAA